MFDNLIENLKSFFKKAWKFMKQFWNKFKPIIIAYSNVDKKYKYIYKNTKSKRIKKKYFNLIFNNFIKLYNKSNNKLVLK